MQRDFSLTYKLADGSAVLPESRVALKWKFTLLDPSGNKDATVEKREVPASTLAAEPLLTLREEEGVMKLQDGGYRFAIEAQDQAGNSSTVDWAGNVPFDYYELTWRQGAAGTWSSAGIKTPPIPPFTLTLQGLRSKRQAAFTLRLTLRDAAGNVLKTAVARDERYSPHRGEPASRTTAGFPVEAGRHGRAFPGG